MLRLRPQDVLFVLFGLLVGTLLAFHFGVAVLALVGAFVCGAVYLFAGMIPSRDEPFWRRTFTSVFLSVVLSSLVLILPGTMGAQAQNPGAVKAVVRVAEILPLLAIGFEVVRTPSVIRGILWCLGYR
jgi:ABC-type iron transport system FetAB permease component